MCIPCWKSFSNILKYITLTLAFDLLLKIHENNNKLYLNVLDLVLIFHMCISCGKTFSDIPKLIMTYNLLLLKINRL